MTDFIPQEELPKYRKKNEPTQCPLFGHSGFIPVIDHDHQTGRIRGVVSSEGNALLGKIENYFKSRGVCAVWSLPIVLRAMADYLERKQGPLHPVGIRQLARRFGRKTKAEQTALLAEIGVSSDEIADCKNSVERTKLYRKKVVDSSQT